MKKGYFVARGSRDSEDRRVAYLRLADSGDGYRWTDYLVGATRFSSERSAYRSVMQGWIDSSAQVLLKTVRVIRVSVETTKRLEVLEILETSSRRGGRPGPYCRMPVRGG